MRARFLTADVFTDQLFGGNPLAVFPDASAIPETSMQPIAREFNLSETVFVLPPDDPAHTCRLRIFTPARELQFAGHPTVGTAFILAAIGQIPMDNETTTVIFEEGVGPVPVEIEHVGGRPGNCTLSAAAMPRRGPQPPEKEVLAAALSLSPDDIIEDEKDRPEAWSAGLEFLMIPVASAKVLGRARPDLAVWERHLAKFWAPSAFPFSYDTAGSDADIRARMFAPTLVSGEDPATGSAVTALAGYLAARLGEVNTTQRWRIDQGVDMGRPSRLDLEVDIENGLPVAVRVGGQSVLVTDGEMTIPD